MIAQSEWMSGSYGILGGDAIENCLRTHGMHLNLSGHIHAVHITERDDVADAALGAYSIAPHHYALATLIDDGTLRYDAFSTCAEHFPEGFPAKNIDFFLRATQNKLAGTLTDPKLTEDEIAAMIRYAAGLNYAYFSGDYQADPALWQEDPTRLLWQNHGNTSRFGEYLERLLSEGAGDMHHVIFSTK